jgi:hypothetical protein
MCVGVGQGIAIALERVAAQALRVVILFMST